jgi:hypothetical protein
MLRGLRQRGELPRADRAYAMHIPQAGAESTKSARQAARLGARLSAMSEADEKQTLHRFLQYARGALLWKLDGLSDYDIRRPMTPTGTNLLGLVKHCAAVDFMYFGLVLDRPFPGQDAPRGEMAGGIPNRRP